MKLIKVPWICDSPEARGSFVLSTNTGSVGYISKVGGKRNLDPEVQEKIKELFSVLEKGRAPGEVVARIDPPPRPMIPILAYVESVERLSKAFRG